MTDAEKAVLEYMVKKYKAWVKGQIVIKEICPDPQHRFYELDHIEQFGFDGTGALDTMHSLQERGYVQLEPSPSHREPIWWLLTDKGLHEFGVFSQPKLF